MSTSGGASYTASPLENLYPPKFCELYGLYSAFSTCQFCIAMSVIFLLLWFFSFGILSRRSTPSISILILFSFQLCRDLPSTSDLFFHRGTALDDSKSGGRVPEPFVQWMGCSRGPSLHLRTEGLGIALHHQNCSCSGNVRISKIKNNMNAMENVNLIII